jgi:hypothetical protein
MLIPTDKEISALHEKYAPTQEAFDLVYTHCEIVCGIAEQLLARTDLNLNADLVRAGSLLGANCPQRSARPAPEGGNASRLDHMASSGRAVREALTARVWGLTGNSSGPDPYNSSEPPVTMSLCMTMG